MKPLFFQLCFCSCCIQLNESIFVCFDNHAHRKVFFGGGGGLHVIILNINDIIEIIY